LGIFPTWLGGKELRGVLRLAEDSEGGVGLASGFAIVSVQGVEVMGTCRVTSFNGERGEDEAGMM